MSVSAEFQKLVVDRLLAADAVKAIVADRIYDRVPERRTFPYISLGPHDIVEDDAECIVSGEHTLQVDVWSRYQGGYLECKRIADAAKKALHHFNGELALDALVEMRVISVRYLRDPDGLTSHGILTITALIEEAA